MNKLTTFYRTAEKPEPEGPGIDWKKAIIGLLVAIGILLIVICGILQGKSLYDRIHTSWEEIRFAYEKPALVKAMRMDYESKSKKLDQSYLQQNETAQDKLVNEVVKKLQDSNLK